MSRSFRLALTLCALVVLNSPALGDNPYFYVRVPRVLIDLAFLSQTGFIADHKQDSRFVAGYLKAEELRDLPPEAQARITLLNENDWQTHDYDLTTLSEVASVPAAETGEDYHTYATLTTELQNLASLHPELATLESAGKTVKGKEMWYVRLTAKSVAEPSKPKLLLISSMHGDEVVGKELLIYLIRDLLAQYGTDTQITSLLNHAEIFIMPSMNPDGTERRQRFNANGVDLNRNFPELDEPPFGGRRAIEVTNVMELHRAHQFLTALNFHTGALCFNMPWDSKPNKKELFGDDTLMNYLARDYATHNVPMSQVNGGSFHHGVTYGYEWYQVLGGMQDWASFFRGASHATVELSNIKWPNANALPGAWRNNREALLSFLIHGTEGIHLKVTDQDGHLLPVDIATDSSTRTLHYEEGYVHRPTVPQTQKVTVSSPGFQSEILTVTPAAFSGEYQAVTLRK